MKNAADKFYVTLPSAAAAEFRRRAAEMGIPTGTLLKIELLRILEKTQPADKAQFKHIASVKSR